MSGRRWAKSFIERTLVAVDAPGRARRRHARDVCILAYHNVVPDDLRVLGDASLHIRIRDFCRHLDHLERHYDVVPVTDVMAAVTTVDRPRVAITFDDAYLGAIALGLGELARRGLPATVFVAPSLLGRRSLWWDVFGPPRATAGDGPGAAVRDEALTQCAGRDDHVRARARSAGWVERAVPEPLLTATVAELEDACRRGTVTLGSHSWSHPNLTRLAVTELEAEMRMPLQWLRTRFSQSIGWLAYPYGLFSAAVEQAAKAAGYDACVAVRGGWTALRPPDPFAIPRVNIPAEISDAGFVLRVSDALSGA
jgi:peptidoglycan/xylan/chitin deacetylase (PgdA/CDA1 family)